MCCELLEMTSFCLAVDQKERKLVYWCSKDLTMLTLDPGFFVYVRFSLFGGIKLQVLFFIG